MTINLHKVGSMFWVWHNPSFLAALSRWSKWPFTFFCTYEWLHEHKTEEHDTKLELKLKEVGFTHCAVVCCQQQRKKYPDTCIYSVFENTGGVSVWVTSGLVIQEQVLRNTEWFFLHPHHCYSSLCSILSLQKDPCNLYQVLKLYHPTWSICQNKQINYLQGNKASWFAASTRHWNTKSNTDWSSFFDILLL